MTAWTPIASYDALPARKRPSRAVFFFAASPHPDASRAYAGLPAMVRTDRQAGSRVCTHYLALPDDPT